MVNDEQEELAINFLPELATVLAINESQKGSPLTEMEVQEITASAPCMTMRKSDYENIIRHRKYRDIDPEDAWADWHRMRSWLVGGYLPAFIFTILCSADTARELKDQIGRNGEEWQVEVNKCGTEQAESVTFKLVGAGNEARRQILDSIGSDDVAVDLVGAFFGSHQAITSAKEALQMVKRCFSLGAKAVCCESSYITHTKDDWLELAETSESEDDSTARWALLEAFVQCPIVREETFITCGLHLLGLPDLIVSQKVAATIDEGGTMVDDNVRRLFYSFAGYLLTECATKPFRSGNTFSMGPDSQRYRIVWEPCSELEEGNILYNPFGYRRVTVDRQ